MSKSVVHTPGESRHTCAMGNPVSSIRNLGPASDRAFARAGIEDADTLRALGPDAAYTRLLESGTRPHFIGYYALVMGLAGRPWTDCRGAEKIALRNQFDALVAKSRPAHDTEIERILDQIGVPKSPTPKPRT